MEKLGNSLEDVARPGKGISNKTMRHLAQQMILRIQALHNVGFIHRDIKPDNFLLGLGERAEHLFLIDMGLAKRFVTDKGDHIMFKKGKSLTGTARYASIHNHQGHELSRRDDMESIGYVLVYLARGGLPWQNLKSPSSDDKYAAIYHRKLATPLVVLCATLDSCYLHYLSYCRELAFEAEPNYEYLINLF